jgi:hypothetical protein
VSTAATNASSTPSKVRQAALGCALLLLDIMAIGVVITAVSDARLTPAASATSASIPTQLGAAPPGDPRAQKAEAALLAQLQAADVPISAQTTVQADALCIVVGAGGTSNAVAAAMIQHVAGLSDRQASTFVDAARATVCHVQG